MGTAEGFVVIVSNGSDRNRVALSSLPLAFGRIAAYNDVTLSDRMVAKRLFEIRWNADHARHEVRDLGARYPVAVNGVPLAFGESRPLSVGDVLTASSFRIEYVESPLRPDL